MVGTVVQTLEKGEDERWRKDGAKHRSGPGKIADGVEVGRWDLRRDFEPEEQRACETCWCSYLYARMGELLEDESEAEGGGGDPEGKPDAGADDAGVDGGTVLDEFLRQVSRENAQPAPHDMAERVAKELGEELAEDIGDWTWRDFCHFVAMRVGQRLATAGLAPNGTFARCVDSRQCGYGLICDCAGFCVEPCTEDSDCPYRMACDAAEGRRGGGSCSRREGGMGGMDGNNLYGPDGMFVEEDEWEYVPGLCPRLNPRKRPDPCALLEEAGEIPECTWDLASGAPLQPFDHGDCHTCTTRNGGYAHLDTYECCACELAPRTGETGWSLGEWQRVGSETDGHGKENWIYACMLSGRVPGCRCIGERKD